jgi:hypothetical protein
VCLESQNKLNAALIETAPKARPVLVQLTDRPLIRLVGLPSSVANEARSTYAFDSVQVVYNLLNPSAAEELPTNYPAQDCGLFTHTQAAGVGVVDRSSGCELTPSACCVYAESNFRYTQGRLMPLKPERLLRTLMLTRQSGAVRYEITEAGRAAVVDD